MFLLTTCHVGAESTVRRVVPAAIAGARPAFARPGVVTFKLERAPSPAAARPHPLVRSWGVSLGVVPELAALGDKLAGVPEPRRIHVVPGEAGRPGKVPDPVLARWQAHADEVALQVGGDPGPAADGDVVVELLVREGEPVIASWHRHGPGRGPLPGGQWPVHAPADAPSRAWNKLEELIAWSGVAPAAGDRALEIGCAPGGATVALLDRGLSVTGVDPQGVVLPPRLAGRPFTQIPKAIEGVPRDDLPAEIEWIVLDVSVAAPVALHALQRLIPRYRPRLRGLFTTLKLNEWDLVDDLPRWLDGLRALGLTVAPPANLWSFRQELGLVGTFT